MRLVKLVDGELIALGATLVQDVPLKDFFNDASYRPGARLIFESDEAITEFMKMRSKTFRTSVLLNIYQTISTSDHQFIIGTFSQLLNRYKRIGLLKAGWNPQGSPQQILAQAEQVARLGDRNDLWGLAVFVLDYQLAAIQQVALKFRDFSSRFSHFALAEGLDKVGKIGLVNGPATLENTLLDYWEVPGMPPGDKISWWDGHDEVMWQGKSDGKDCCFAVELPQIMPTPNRAVVDLKQQGKATVQRMMPLDLVSAMN